MAGTSQSVPSSARDYASALRRETAAAVDAAQRQWRRMGDDFDSSFVRIAPTLIQVANTSQARVASLAGAFIPTVLADTDAANVDMPRFEIDDRQWVGTAGDGMPTETLLYGSVTRAKSAIGGGATVEAALAAGGSFLTTALDTLLADTSRGVESAATYARPIGGYVRMLQTPSCGRCIILAGKWFRKNEGFKRHPRCDCRHIPTAENAAGDMTTDPKAYLDSLDDKALAKALGSNSNAKAYTEFGADPGQLVNAYRQPGGRRGPGGIPSVKTAQVYGKNVKYTLEGTTTRGVAYHQMSNVRALSRMGDGVRNGRRVVNAPRLMPESIFQIAENQTHATRLLRDHGWLGIG